MAAGRLLTCPNCGKDYHRSAREHFCSDKCRFWHKVKRGENNECWLWLGTKPAFGHGQFVFDGHVIYAHRHSWVLVNGPVPDGMCVLHKCDVPSCVNPSHLFLGTREDNLADMRGKNRGSQPPHRRCAAHHNAKITEDDVRVIRASSDSQLSLAERYGITRRVINSIINRKTWVHVDETSSQKEDKAPDREKARPTPRRRRDRRR